jgi:8-oxo-dGTP diphosphatase
VQPSEALERRAIEVAAGLVFSNGKLLITQRRPDDHLGGYWEFPGGKRESGESFEACLERELREELGIEVKVNASYDQIVHAYAEKTVDLRFYTCDLIGGTPQPIACAAVAWVTPMELDQYSFPAADAQLLKKLKADSDSWR